MGLQRLIAFRSISLSKSIIFLFKDPGDCFIIQATGLMLISNKKQVSHYNGKKSIFSINSTHSEFLIKKRTHKRKSIILSKLIFSNHSKSLIEKQISSKYFLSHIDQIIDTLLVWAYCILLFLREPFLYTTNHLLKRFNLHP